MRVTTIREHGSQFPIGRLDDQNRLLKDFRLRPYKGWVDRVLEPWLDRNAEKTQGDLVVKLLSLLFESLCGESYPLSAEKDSTPEMQQRIMQLYQGDVLYAYLLARINAVGPKIVVPFSCPSPGCTHAGQVVADLYDTEVRVIDSPKELRKKITLRNGLKLRTGRTAKVFVVQPITFAAHLEYAVGNAGVGSTSFAQLREAIVSVDCEDGRYTPTDAELDELDKIDMIAIDRQASNVAAGPMLATKQACDKCGLPNAIALEWTYSSFFDHSVPPTSLG